MIRSIRWLAVTVVVASLTFHPLHAKRLGQSCWSGQTIYTPHLMVNAGTCIPACQNGQNCIRAIFNSRINCDADGDTGCTYCLWSMWGRWDPTANGGAGDWIYDVNGSVGSGFVNCDDSENFSPSVSRCYAPGTQIDVVSAVYDVPCAQVDLDTDWTGYRNQMMVVPNLPGDL